MADIFVSHSHEDRDRIDPIVQQLHADGYEVWWDVELRGGAVYAKEIEAQIEKAKAVIVVWSASSMESNWVADEAELALRGNKLVPILLDGDEAPIGFRQIQTIDFTNWNGRSDDDRSSGHEWLSLTSDSDVAVLVGVDVRINAVLTCPALGLGPALPRRRLPSAIPTRPNPAQG